MLSVQTALWLFGIMKAPSKNHARKYWNEACLDCSHEHPSKQMEYSCRTGHRPANDLKSAHLFKCAQCHTKAATSHSFQGTEGTDSVRLALLQLSFDHINMPLDCLPTLIFSFFTKCLNILNTKCHNT